MAPPSREVNGADAICGAEMVSSDTSVGRRYGPHASGAVSSASTTMASDTDAATVPTRTGYGSGAEPIRG